MNWPPPAARDGAHPESRSTLHPWSTSASDRLNTRLPIVARVVQSLFRNDLTVPRLLLLLTILVTIGLHLVELP